MKGVNRCVPEDRVHSSKSALPDIDQAEAMKVNCTVVIIRIRSDFIVADLRFPVLNEFPCVDLVSSGEPDPIIKPLRVHHEDRREQIARDERPHVLDCLSYSISVDNHLNKSFDKRGQNNVVLRNGCTLCDSLG